MKVRREVQGEDKREKGNDEREDTNVTMTPRENHQQCRAYCRSERDQSQNVVV